MHYYSGQPTQFYSGVDIDHLVPSKKGRPHNGKVLSTYLIKIARLGRHLARASNPLPGNGVMWHGRSRLADIKLGAMLDAGLLGN